MLDLGKWVTEMFLRHLVMGVCFSQFFFSRKGGEWTGGVERDGGGGP